MASTAMWMEPTGPIDPPTLLFFRNRFVLTEKASLDLTWSADEHAVLFLDGERVADGPERGTDQRWHKERLVVDLMPGEHCLSARVLALGEKMRPMAQMSVRHGLYVRERSRLLSPEWECRRAENCRFHHPQPDWGTVARIETAPGFDPDWQRGGGAGWEAARMFEDRRRLIAPDLPPMRREPVTDFQWNGRAVRFREYLIGWAEYTFRGEGTVELRWFETAKASDIHADCPKESAGDRLVLTGGEFRWHDLWWRAGQRLEIHCAGTVEVAEMRFFRTGYPFRHRVDFVDADPATERLLNVARHTLECCAVDTYLDCPFYEQLQYVADSRIEILSTLAIGDDVRLPEKTLRQLALGQRADGALACRHPSRDRLDQYEPRAQSAPLIPAFALLYIQMVHDYARLRRNDALVRELLPVMRRIAAWAGGFRLDGLLRGMPGWNFIDWLPAWKHGIPPDGENGGGCTLNWIHVRSLRDLADMERHFGSSARAAAYAEAADEHEAVIHARFFDPARGGYAENEAGGYFSEHAQVFALAAADRREVLPLLASGTLAPCGISFSFYFLEICRRHGLDRCFEKRFDRYRRLAASGLSTMPEEFIDQRGGILKTGGIRSHCHAWSAHALYFRYAKDSFLDPIPSPSSAPSASAKPVQKEMPCHRAAALSPS